MSEVHDYINKTIKQLNDVSDILSATIDNIRTEYILLHPTIELTIRQSLELTIDYLALTRRTVKKRIHSFQNSLDGKLSRLDSSNTETKGC